VYVCLILKAVGQIKVMTGNLRPEVVIHNTGSGGPGYGGTQRLARSIGVHRAKMMTFTGDIYFAQELYEWGLISKLYSPDELLE